ncbi:MAG: glucosaminidase domain-containing protein [Lachnospiraceae bacterium]|nr:glucosaminidase domain-containing protein [Lachnospiraceae bacterium]MCM1238375.1 glucosaminidase domain-containing protein [Lachnospiraceae bacterium]
MKKRICLDPGHYGSKYNAGAVAGYYESAIVWKLTQYEKGYLEAMGIDVLVTRETPDENPDLTTRGKMSSGCNLFVSNHTNACGTPSVNRAVVIHLADRTETFVDDRSVEFATQLAKVIQNTMGVSGMQVYSRLSSSDRDGDGKKNDNYYGVLNGCFLAGVPGVIAEHSFHTNKETCEWLLDDANLRKLARACAECMAAFVGVSADAGDGLQAAELNGMEMDNIIQRVGEICADDMEKTGVLASVSLAQFILESGCGKSVLAQNANNCFGMKCLLSGNTWNGSTWDGVGIFTKDTQEFIDGEYRTVQADFRVYPDIEASIADHSAYLLGAKKDVDLRYDGLKGLRDYKKAVQIIKDGGYATDPEYVSKVCGIIEAYGLTKYDQVQEATGEWYRVRTEWGNAGSQIGAYHSLELAKAMADRNPGYCVYDGAGSRIYPVNAFKAYTVKVKIHDLNMRIGASVDSASIGHIPAGSYTIVEEQTGKVGKDGKAGLWGRLKSEQNYDGKYIPVWICLAYTEKN